MQHAKVKGITFTFKEGYSYHNDAFPLTVATFKQANALLKGWSNEAPKTGGYDKTDFKVEWENGETYKGRYDLKHWECQDEHCDVARHMTDYLGYLAGQNCPSHMTEQSYRQDVGEGNPQAIGMLATLSFED